jgi:O-antigen ligase
MFSNIYILWISILPFITWGGRFEIPKVLTFLVGGFVISCFWIYRVLVKKYNFDFSKADVFYILWLLTLIISSLFGVHPFDSIVGGSYRHQGFIFFLTLWLMGKTISILEEDKKKLLIKTFAFGILLESLIVLFQMISGHLYFGKPLGTLGEANAVAGFLAIGVFFIYESLPSICILLPFISILFSESRTGILSFLVNLGPMVSRFTNKFKRLTWAILVTLTLLLLFIFSEDKLNSFFESRSTFWKLGIESIFQRPVLGYGAETGEYVYEWAFYKTGFPLSNLTVDRSHNLFIDITMWSGFTGLILFVGFLLFSYKNLKTISQKFAFFSFLIYSMFQPLSIIHWILLFLILYNKRYVS